MFPFLQKALNALNRGRIRFINRDIEKHTEKMYSLGINVIQSIFVISGVHFGNTYYFQNIQIVSTCFFLFSFFISIGLFRSIIKNKPTGLD